MKEDRIVHIARTAARATTADAPVLEAVMKSVTKREVSTAVVGRAIGLADAERHEVLIVPLEAEVRVADPADPSLLPLAALTLTGLASLVTVASLFFPSLGVAAVAAICTAASYWTTGLFLRGLRLARGRRLGDALARTLDARVALEERVLEEEVEEVELEASARQDLQRRR